MAIVSEEIGNWYPNLTLLPSESVESGVDPPSSEWLLVGIIGSSELGTPDRLMKLEEMKQRKTHHGETAVV